MNVGRGEAGAVDVITGRIFIQDQLEIFECRGIIVSVPVNLTDLIQRLRRFSALGEFPRDQFERWDGFVSGPRREIEVRELHQIAQPPISI